jgi:hypothetical protein
MYQVLLLKKYASRFGGRHHYHLIQDSFSSANRPALSFLYFVYSSLTGAEIKGKHFSCKNILMAG